MILLAQEAKNLHYLNKVKSFQIDLEPIPLYFLGVEELLFSEIWPIKISIKSYITIQAALFGWISYSYQKKITEIGSLCAVQQHSKMEEQAGIA